MTFLVAWSIKKLREPWARNSDAKKTFIKSFLCYYGGLALWIFEIQFCDQLPFLGDLVPLHACWHILAGYGTYLWVQFMYVLQAAFLRRKLRWEHAACAVPYACVAV